MATTQNLTLSKRQWKQYLEIKEAFETGNTISMSTEDYIRLKEVLLLLQMLEYIRHIEADNVYLYMKQGDLKDFEAWHKDMVREERKITRREWKIAIISAVIGAIIGLIPTIITVLK